MTSYLHPYTEAQLSALTASPADKGVWEILGDTPGETFDSLVQRPITVDDLDYRPNDPELAVHNINEGAIADNAQAIYEKAAPYGERYALTMSDLYKRAATDIFNGSGEYGIMEDPTYAFAEIGLLATTDEAGNTIETFEGMLTEGARRFNTAFKQYGINDEGYFMLRDVYSAALESKVLGIPF